MKATLGASGELRGPSRDLLRVPRGNYRGSLSIQELSSGPSSGLLAPPLELPGVPRSAFPAAQTLPFAFSGAIGALWVPWERFVDVLGAAIRSSVGPFVVWLVCSNARSNVCERIFNLSMTSGGRQKLE